MMQEEYESILAAIAQQPMMFEYLPEMEDEEAYIENPVFSSCIPNNALQ